MSEANGRDLNRLFKTLNPLKWGKNDFPYFFSFMLDVQIQSFKYPNPEDTPVLKDVSFSIKKGEHLSVLGGSGSGKSTLLHLVYGLFTLDNGTIHYNKERLLGPSHNLIPGEPFMKLVAQELDIMPFISVAENIASHLDRNDRAKDDARVDELLAVVHLAAFKHVKVKNLSGGQKQRVAIAKALAQKPEVLLLDEPFSSIDTFLKNTLRRSFFSYTRSQNIMCIIATHDSEEALSFTDRMLLLHDGKQERLDTPKDIYENLENTYQASFFGEVSVIDAALLPYGENAKTSKPAIKNRILLPHQLRISEVKTALEVTVITTFYQGNNYLVQAKDDDNTIYFYHHSILTPATKLYLTLR